MREDFILIGIASLTLAMLLAAGCSRPAETEVITPPADDAADETAAGISDTCKSSTSGIGMNFTEARHIAEGSECGSIGELKETQFCNEGTATAWIDIEPDDYKKGCNPACVVNVETKQAEINWRCTGLIVPEDS